MIQKMDITVLSAFVAVVETGGFRRAGDRLSRTQSAVSMQIRRLEERVGARLLDREGTTITLTAQGERLLPHARGDVKGIMVRLDASTTVLALITGVLYDNC